MSKQEMTLHEVLNDPLIRLLALADGISSRELESLLRVARAKQLSPSLMTHSDAARQYRQPTKKPVKGRRSPEILRRNKT